MTQPLAGKTAVVTGGSRGIGRAIVERLARDGATVVFGYRSRDDEAKAVEEAVPSARGFRADLAEPGAIRELLDCADQLDVLVLNAAATFVPTPLADVSDEEYERIFAINVRAPFRALRHAARHMRDHGRIIAISTLNTLMPPPGGSLYVGSKGATEQFAAVAAKELGPRGITVNTVSPGATDTDLLRSTNPPEALARISATTPLGRLGEPADIADVVGFLAGPDGRWITGQNIRAGGGLA